MLQKQSSVGYLKSTKINSQAKDKSFQFKRRIRRQYNPDDINIAKLFLAIREHRTGNPQLDKTNAIKELLTQVDNINDTDYNDNGNTPLHVAVSKRHLDIVKLLLSTRDINPKAKNNRGQTPLDIINEDLNSKSKTSLDQDIIQELQGASSLKRENTGENKPEVGSPKKLRISSIKKEEPEETKIEEGDPRTYPASGLKHTLHGNIYQLKLLMLFLKRGLEKGYSFHLATEWDDAEKFDDLVFIHNDQNRRKSYRFLQAKHKQNEDNKKIGIGDLLTEDKNGEFRLAKYFVSYLKIKNNQDFADGDLKDFIICTNIDFDLDQDTAQNAVKKLKMQTIKKNKGKEIWVETIDDSDVFFKDGGTRYKVSYNENDITSIVQQEFKVAVEETMEELKKEVKKLQDKSDQDSKKKLGRNQRWQNEFKQITNSKLKDNIKEFFDKLVFAVDQSNEVELGKILETEISKEFKEKFNYIGELGQSVYYEFQNEILDWMKKKEGSFLSEAEVKDFFRKAGQQVSTLSAIKEGVDRIEEKLVKVEQNNKQVEKYIWFNIKSPSQLFTGRKEELNRLHSGLQICKDRMGVISQLSTISGLGGIGKTELARKYAHEYGKEYSNNVIWIDAEKRETIVELFYRLAQDELMISIKNADGERKSIKSIVKEVFGFFSKKKSLFIFDNAEEFKDLSQFLPLNFLTPDANKPDILITSRNREWGKGISIIDLDTLNLNDSIELVKKGLGINDKSQDQQIENLVEKLQHFPLAIRQAIAYIEDKQVTKRPSVSDYLEEYRKKTRKLINYKVFNEIDNDYAKTTFTTWQVTIDRIAIDEQCGQLALKILDIIAYFAHGNIITKMFLSLACGDEKQLESAIRLLIKYSMVNDEQGQNVLSIHRLVQEVTILKLKEQQREEEVLREALELIKSSIIVEENISHIISILNYSSRYDKLIDDFYYDSIYEEHKYTPLHLLVQGNKEKAVENVLKNLKCKKYPSKLIKVVNSIDEHGYSPLRLAVENGNLKIVKYLVENGADFNIVDEDGMTPIKFSALRGNVELVKCFIDMGADINAFLHIAAENSTVELVKYLIGERGADCNVLDENSMTPLHFVAENGNLELVTYLINHNARVNIRDRYGLLPLHYAAKNGNSRIVKYLVENGANYNVLNQDIKTALDLASDNKHYEVVQYLKIVSNKKSSSNTNQEERHISYEPEEERHISYEPEEERHISYEPEEERHISYEPEEERHISYEPEEEGTIDRCLPSSGYRRKREIENECLFTWEDVDEFNEAKDEKRNFGKINSEKFVDYIKDLSEEKRSQLIGLADQVEVTGKSQGLIHKLTNNIRVMSHLAKVGKISGMTMHGMMAKNVLADFLNGNYQGVAINVGFIAGGQGFAKVAEAASIKGLKLASEGKLLLGRSLKAASPFLARGTSAFVVYDIVNQVKAFKNGTEEALVGVIGDSIYLSVDAAEIGIEIAEAFEVLEGVSSITGPIGATIGAVVFVGTDIYTAVKKVDKIDQIIHLNGDERLIEGLRAFMGMQPEQYIEKLIEKKQVSNQLVNQGLEYLKQHSDIEGYVFPTGELVVDSDQKVSHRLQMDLDNLALLGNTVDNVIWHKAKPDNPNIGKLFCLPTGPIRSSIGGENAYLCHNAIGLSYLDDRTGNSTLIALGKGKDQATGFRDSPNIFLVDDGDKDFTGGDKDDVFILVGNKTIGTLDGSNGNNTLNLAGFALDRDYIDVKFKLSSHYGSIFSPSDIVIKNIHKIYGRKGKQDIIDYGCDIRYVDGQGGKSNDSPDHIIIPYCYSVNRKKIIVRPSTKIDNSGESRHEIFDYIILPDEGKANINIKYDYAFTQQRKHNFLFNYTLFDLASVNIENVKDINYGYAGYGKMTHAIRNVTFSFLSPALKGKSIHEKFDITISDIPVNASYIIGNNAEIKIGNKGNLYTLENTNQPVDEVINSYLTMANRLKKISFFIQSRNETIVIGSGNHEVIYNNPLYKSHLVGNGGENIYVIDSESEGFEINKLSLPEVVVYDLDAESSVDTIDLRNLVQQARSKFSNKDSFELKVLKSESDLLLKATVIEAEPTEDSSVSKIRKHEYFTVRLKDGVNWYNKTHVIVDNFPVKISLDNNEWSLRPQPLVFEKDKGVIIVTGRDVEENTELIIPRKGGNYTFVREHGTDLMITNVFDANITQEDLCTITLSGFYEELKMETLSIKFADKEIVLKDHREEISTARDMNIVKKEHSEQVYNDVFNHAKSESEVVLVDQVAHKHRHEHSRHRIRNRRSESIISSSTRPSSWINDLFGWVKSSIGGLLGSRAALPEKTFTQSSISQISAPIDVNGTIMLLDVLIRKATGQKYISTVDQSISPLEAQGYALNITNRFEKVLNKTAIKSGISVTNLNFDPVVVQSAIIEKIINGRSSGEITKTLYSFAKEACPEFKQTDKFIDHLRSNLKEEKETVMLQQKVEKPYKDLSQEVSRKVQLSKKPDTFLNGTSVVQGISRAIN